MKKRYQHIFGSWKSDKEPRKMNNKCPSWWGKGAKANMKQALYSTKPTKSQALGAQLPEKVGQGPCKQECLKACNRSQTLDPLPHLTNPHDCC